MYQTCYKAFRRASSSSSPLSSLSRDFNELIVFPIRLADLPLSSQVTFTVWDATDVSELEDPLASEGNGSGGGTRQGAERGIQPAKVIGGSTMKLFGKKGTLKKASHRLYLWPNQAGDGSAETSTPSKVASEPGKKRDEMARLEKVCRVHEADPCHARLTSLFPSQLIKLHERSDLPHLLWLDKLAYRQIEKVHAEESLQSSDIYLYVDLPRFETPIVFCEQESTSLPPSSTAAAQVSQGGASSSSDPAVPSSASRGIDASLFTIYDGDMLMERDNPVEAKHRRLVRSHRSGPLDRELKPNAGVRDELNVRLVIFRGAAVFSSCSSCPPSPCRTYSPIRRRGRSARVNQT